MLWLKIHRLRESDRADMIVAIFTVYSEHLC